MNYLFTSAAERVLNHAAAWLDPADSLELDSRAILLGLLTETECRAAHLLAQHGVSMRDVCETWGISQKCSPPCEPESSLPNRFNRDLNFAMHQAYLFALEFERTPILATEHLLLALLCGDDKTTQWLIERGACRQSLEADIRQRNGYVDAPLDIEDVLEEGSEKGESITVMAEHANCNSVIANFPLHIEQTNSNDQRPTANDQRPSPPSSALLRILDAAANRAREGLRAVEDYLRFVLDDRFLTAAAKQLRHDLVAEMKKIPTTDMLASRETQADVGTGLTAAAETVRADLADVPAANFGRLEESLRSLEEYGKLIDTAMAAAFKQIRYRIYTLERAVAITRQSADRLAAAKLYVLIDGRDSLDEFRDFTSSLIAAGVHILQLRDKQLDDRQLLARARLLRELTRGTATLFIMNDRPDLAALSRADGVHLGQEELSVKDARTILGPQALIGVSAHTIEQARQAVLDGANYIGVGPTFPSTTKDFAAFPGLDLLRAVAAEIRLPAFAIGGITLENLPSVLATGITRVAVSGTISKSENPSCMVKDFVEKIT
jgi:thiamine-phosphate pyrophosphorylase